MTTVRGVIPGASPKALPNAWPRPLLDRLEAADARLIVARQDHHDASGKRYVLTHDRLAEAVVAAVEEEGTKLDPVDRELIRLRKLVALNAELCRARAVRQATDLDRKQFQKIQQHSAALLWDDERRQWWQECQQRRRSKRRSVGM